MSVAKYYRCICGEIAKSVPYSTTQISGKVFELYIPPTCSNNCDMFRMIEMTKKEIITYLRKEKLNRLL